MKNTILWKGVSLFLSMVFILLLGQVSLASVSSSERKEIKNDFYLPKWKEVKNLFQEECQNEFETKKDQRSCLRLARKEYRSEYKERRKQVREWIKICKESEDVYLCVGYGLGLIEDEQEEVSPEESSSFQYDFHYQLQSTSLDTLQNLDTPYLVIDIDDTGFSAVDIASLKATNKTVLSYLSIGEAEDYRWYWESDWNQNPPSFLDEENPDWAGNFKVKYWDESWQSIIVESIENIAGMGYDGAYLDIVDAYWYYESEGRESAALEMIDFIALLREKAQAINPDFMIIAQNAVELYAYEEYRNLIDGFGKESLFFQGNNIRQSSEETDYLLPFLKQAQSDGKKVFLVEYPSSMNAICQAYEQCRSEGFSCGVFETSLSISSPVSCLE